MFISLSKAFKPKSSKVVLQKTEAKALGDLNSTGWTDLGVFIHEDDISEIFGKLENFALKDRYRPVHGEFLLNSVPSDTHVADYIVDDWNNLPEIVKIANSPSILNIAEGYLGCKPTISNLQLWWSFSGHENSEEAENFHRDVDDWKFVKFFIYLTDVDLQSGPHTYVQKSINSHRHLPIKRYSDTEIEKYFGKENIKIMTGKKGSAFMEDTFGFHKGQLAKEDRRLVLQVQYSINPIAINSYTSKDSIMEIDPYINRLYLKRKES